MQEMRYPDGEYCSSITSNSLIYYFFHTKIKFKIKSRNAKINIVIF